MDQPDRPATELWRARLGPIVERFKHAWQGGQPPNIDDYLPEGETKRRALLIELVLADLECRLDAGEPARVEYYLERYPDLAGDPDVVPQLVKVEYAHRRCREPSLTPAEYCKRFPEYEQPLRHWMADLLTVAPHPPTGSASADPASVQGSEVPIRLGRYRIQEKLGSGGFGAVYKGYDEELQRAVAIKVPHRHHVRKPEDAEDFLAEARVVAALDHPHIVPVYDVGRTEEGLCFVVSKFIEGSDLAKKLAACRLAPRDAVELVAAVAEALHHAHKQGLVHRDIKPGNILIDREGKSYAADFGLALREEDYGKGANFAGTPAYMSPEQANGEGHRVDGRSDIFSLGVVFYELLTGRRPFRGDKMGVLAQVLVDQPRPPRQIDDTIPKELERICLKALSKRASERYTTAKDFADDLRHFQAGRRKEEGGRMKAEHPAPAGSLVPPSSCILPPSDKPVKIVPQGLRAFDTPDADFFLELLPGPCDRDGLPDTLRFWKTRIEEMDADNTFSVGLLYGPSGCGKSSLVKAGLLPRLANHVLGVYVAATDEETESRLMKGLRKHCPDLPGSAGLVEILTALRRGQTLPPGKKVLIILDQFEQWLHAKQELETTELIRALRQCDGGRLQCLVLVRDDFWLAVSRFMGHLEVDLFQGRNMALVDLFDPRHARKVLAAFGRAFGALPEGPRDLTKDQTSFLDQAVAGLAQEGKVISIRLALFAEMVKGKPWAPATLKEIGGMEGVGVRFLEETFAATTAPPQHRLHQRAAQAVLKVLLPEAGTTIKGNMRSQEELLAASGYASRPKDFAKLVRILDNELRLVTPTDPEGAGAADQQPHFAAGGRFYQLTHDYLVPSLGDWLTRKQKETRRGRAELLLADRAVVWSARPENRQLPSLWQWLQIRCLTRKKDWTSPQRKLMGRALRYHVLRGAIVAVLLTLAGWGTYEGNGRIQAHSLRGRLLDANTNEVPAIVREMAPYRRWLDPLLNDAHGQAEASQDARKQLHASLALLPVDATQVEYLCGRLLDAEPHEVLVLREQLAPHKEELVDRLWEVVEQPRKGNESQRLRAAAALALYDPSNPRWDNSTNKVVEDLVPVNPVYLGLWSEAFRPVKNRLIAFLSAIHRGREPGRAAERTLATNLLADYAAEQPRVLADLLLDADATQFAILYPKLKEQGEPGLRVLIDEVERKLPAEVTDDAKEKLAKRQANAAVALLKMNQPGSVWPLLKHSPDPRVRSQLIHSFGPLGADVEPLVRRLAAEPDVTIRRALILSLGPEEFGDEAWTLEVKKPLVRQLQEIYRTAADPGLHAAAEWLLRQWKEDAWLTQTEAAWAKDKALRAKRLEGIQQVVAREKNKAPPQWYVTDQGQTMVVIPGPVEFRMGSPSTEKGHQVIESQHRRRIGRTFAIAAKPVTVEQFQRFRPNFSPADVQRFPESACPACVNWFQAARYCNFLSERENIPQDQWCYEANAEGRPRAKRNYLSLTGYRLPSEAEWEYACRAETVTSRYFGESADWLKKYAWNAGTSKNRTWPVGSKKPNDLGLFDMLGNVRNWCQDSAREYPRAGDELVAEDKEDPPGTTVAAPRMSRGCGIGDSHWFARSARRLPKPPTETDLSVGFRVARTLP